jgi:hypothetical protein
LIQRIWVANNGNTTGWSGDSSPMRLASSTPKNIVSTSPMFEESR